MKMHEQEDTKRFKVVMQILQQKLATTHKLFEVTQMKRRIENAQRQSVDNFLVTVCS
jgi:hypothetical protein